MVARGLILGVVMCTLAACGSSAAAPSQSSSSGQAASAHCGPASAHTLAASSGARVFSLAGVVYGCAPGTGRRYELGSASRCIGSARVGPVAASGDLAAYAVQTCGVDLATATVAVRRLSDGRRLYSHVALTASPGPESFESVGSIALDRDGALGWIASASSIASHRRLTQVLARNGSGARVLATGSNIRTDSLRQRGSRLTWSADGAQHSAPLG